MIATLSGKPGYRKKNLFEASNANSELSICVSLCRGLRR